MDRAYKRLSAVESWENTRKASIEAQLMKIEVSWSIILQFSLATDWFLDTCFKVFWSLWNERKKWRRRKRSMPSKLRTKLLEFVRKVKRRKQPLRQSEKNSASRSRKPQQNIVLQGSSQRLYSNASGVEMLGVKKKNKLLYHIWTVIVVFAWFCIELAGDDTLVFLSMYKRLYQFAVFSPLITFLVSYPLSQFKLVVLIISPQESGYVNLWGTSFARKNNLFLVSGGMSKWYIIYPSIKRWIITATRWSLGTVFTFDNQASILCRQIMVHSRNTVRYQNKY